MEALIVLSVTNMGVGDGESVPLANVRVRRVRGVVVLYSRHVETTRLDSVR